MFRNLYSSYKIFLDKNFKSKKKSFMLWFIITKKYSERCSLISFININYYIKQTILSKKNNIIINTKFIDDIWRSEKIKMKLENRYPLYLLPDKMKIIECKIFDEERKRFFNRRTLLIMKSITRHLSLKS